MKGIKRWDISQTLYGLLAERWKKMNQSLQIQISEIYEETYLKPPEALPLTLIHVVVKLCAQETVLMEWCVEDRFRQYQWKTMRCTKTKRMLCLWGKFYLLSIGSWLRRHRHLWKSHYIHSSLQREKVKSPSQLWFCKGAFRGMGGNGILGAWPSRVKEVMMLSSSEPTFCFLRVMRWDATLCLSTCRGEDTEATWRKRRVTWGPWGLSKGCSGQSKAEET